MAMVHMKSSHGFGLFSCVQNPLFLLYILAIMEIDVNVLLTFTRLDL